MIITIAFLTPFLAVIVVCLVSLTVDTPLTQKSYVSAAKRTATIFLELDKIKEFYYLAPSEYRFDKEAIGDGNIVFMRRKNQRIFPKTVKEQFAMKRWIKRIRQDKEERKLNDNLLKFLQTTVTSDIEHLKQEADKQKKQGCKTVKHISESMKGRMTNGTRNN